MYIVTNNQTIYPMIHSSIYQSNEPDTHTYIQSCIGVNHVGWVPRPPQVLGWGLSSVLGLHEILPYVGLQEYEMRTLSKGGDFSEIENLEIIK